ncbi:hypothetical protein BDF19DRAFT_452155 [Syncephalis fuscata]|nr:hypothetical protein BDF19DRAFT_452155 [Syncephalis fuscata]
MDVRIVFLLFVGTVVYFVYFYHGRKKAATAGGKKKKKKRHGKKQTIEALEEKPADVENNNKPENNKAAKKHKQTVEAKVIANTSTSYQTTKPTKKDSSLLVVSEDTTSTTTENKIQQDEGEINTKFDKVGVSNSLRTKQQQQQFDTDFPTLPETQKTHQENNDMLPEEKGPVYARVLRITPPEKEKKEPIAGARRQRAIAGPDGWYTVKTVAESSLPRTTRPVVQQPEDDDGLTKRQRANQRRAERNKEEKAQQQLEQEQRLMNHRLTQMKALYKQ